MEEIQVKSARKKKILLVSLLIVLVLVIGGFTYYWLIYKNNLAKQTNLGTDETADWPSYQNNIFGYSIKYPKIWQVDEQDLAAVKFSKQGSHDATLGSSSTTLVEILSNSDDNSLKVEDWAENSLKNQKAPLSETLIGGKVAVLANINLDGLKIQEGFLIADEIRYQLKQIDSTQTTYDYFTQMLKSFKLIAIKQDNSQSTNVTTDILSQTYTDEKYGLSMKYPKDWYSQDLGNANDGQTLTQIGFAPNNLDKNVFLIKITNRSLDNEITLYKAGLDPGEISSEQDSAVGGKSGKKVISLTGSIETVAIFIDRNNKTYIFIGESKNRAADYQLYYNEMVASINFLTWR